MLCGPAGTVTSSLMHCCSQQGALLTAWESKMLAYRMSEGRKAHVILPDERRLEVVVQPKQCAKDLLDTIASHLNLREKDYFGLSVLDESGHFQWLQLDKRVLENDFNKKSGPIEIYFAIRFFIEKVTYLQDAVTVELFFQNAVRAVYNGELECDADTVFKLAAWVLQALYGDYMDPVTTQDRLKKMTVVPARVLKQHSVEYCEEHIIDIYHGLQGHRHGQAVLMYMSIVESIPSYGIHFYQVKDKTSSVCWLGLSCKGISVFERSDHSLPSKVFSWKHLENLYFRDRKFSIEVHDPKRRSHGHGYLSLYEDAMHDPYDTLSTMIRDRIANNRHNTSTGNKVMVHTWFAASSNLTRCIWSMAVSQHQFYLDRKQCRQSQLQHSRSLTDVAILLNQQHPHHHQPPPHPPQRGHTLRPTGSSTTAAPHLHYQQHHPAGLSLSSHYDYVPPFSIPYQQQQHHQQREITAEDIEQSRVAKHDMYVALKARRDALEAALKKKVEELKLVCIAEAQITGTMPPETPVGSGESLPPVPRKVGTEFLISAAKLPPSGSSRVEDALAQLELECDLQHNIARAALKLANDRTAPTNIVKQRKLFHKKSISKLRETEKRLEKMRRTLGKAAYHRSQNSLDDCDHTSSPVPYHEYTGSLPHPGKSSQLTLIEPIVISQAEVVTMPTVVSAVQPVTVTRQSSTSSRPTTPGLTTTAAPLILRPKSPDAGIASSHHHVSTVAAAGGGGAPGYVPSSVYTTRTSYRDRMYPTHAVGSSVVHQHTAACPHHVSVRPSMKTCGGEAAAVTTGDSGIYRASRVLDGTVLPFGNGNINGAESELIKTGSLGTRPHRTPTRQRMASHEDVLERSGSSRETSASPGLSLDLAPSKFGSQRDSTTAAAATTSLGGQTEGDAVFVASQPLIDGQQQEQSHVHHHHLFHAGGQVQSVVLGGGGPDSGVKSAFSVPPPSNGQSVAVSRQVNQLPQVSSAPSAATAALKKSRDNLHMSNAAVMHGGMPRSANVVQHLANFSEVSKPFEMADVYKYSEQRRRQHALSATGARSQLLSAVPQAGKRNDTAPNTAAALSISVGSAVVATELVSEDAASSNATNQMSPKTTAVTSQIIHQKV